MKKFVENSKSVPVTSFQLPNYNIRNVSNLPFLLFRRYLETRPNDKFFGL
jgi:hypothetical protein